MKGFSLFTPLVGTTVIMIAIVVSAAMIQNDVQISRGLTASYEVSSQSIASKIIRAAIDVKVIENIDSVLDSFMRGAYSHPPITVVCTNKGSCLLRLKDRFTSSSNTLIRELGSGGGGVYSGVINSIEAVTNYKSVPKACSAAVCSGAPDQTSCCISEFLINNPDVIKASFVEQRLQIWIDPAVLAKQNDLFSVTFENRLDRYDRVTLSIIPHGFIYESQDEIESMLSKSADAFEDAKDGECLFPRSIDRRLVVNVRQYGVGTDIRLEIDWGTSFGTTFTVALQNTNRNFIEASKIC
jgi:hypothetical protein